MKPIQSHIPDSSTLLDSVPGFIAVIDQQLNLSALYGARSELIRTRMDAQESLYLPCLFAPECRQEIESKLQDALATGDAAHFEANLDATDTWFENCVAAQVSAEGVTCLVIIGSDITAHKKLETELREQQQFLNSLLETIPGWVAVYDHDEQKSTFANQRMVDFHGVPLEATERHSYVMETTIHPDDFQHVLHYGNHTLPNLSDGEVTSIEYRGRAADGSWRWLDIRDTVLKRHPDGSVWQTLGVAIDITDRKEAEANLLDIQRRYQAIFDQSNDAILISTHDTEDMNVTELLAANPKALDILGYTFEELRSLENGPSSTIAEDEDDLARRNHEMVNEVENLPLYERTAVSKQGQRIPLEINMITVHGGAVQPTYLIAIARDISERKRQEAAIRESERFARSTVDALSAHIAILDEDGTIVAVNNAWRDFAEKNGARSNVGEGASYLAICDSVPNDLAEARTFAQGIRAVLSGEIERFEMEYGCHSPDEKRWFVGRVTRFHGDGPVSVVVAHEDVTERKERELQLRYYASLQETVSDAVVSTNMDLCIQSWNRAAERIYGWGAEEVLGKSVSDLLQTRYETSVVGDTAMHDLLQKGAWQGEVIQRHKNGAELNILGSITLFRAENGTPIGVVGVNHDITERKRQEQALEQAVELARAASAAKSIFLAHMSHELRTPLNAILGYAQLLANEANLEDSVRQRLTAIDRSGQHLLQIINDVLDMARVETGRVTLNNTSVDLPDLIENLRQVFTHRVEQKGLHLELDVTPDLPRQFLTDEGKLRQILTNLIGNAIKFTEAGSIILRVAFTPDNVDKGQLFLAVQDTGRGIYPDQFDRLFQPFEQLSAGDVGTGLGLSISRNFARLMGGDIHVNSTPGSGSTFTLELPVVLADVAGLTSDTLEVIGLAPNQPEPRILVVEDDEDSRKVLIDILQSIGLTPQTAADGQAALDIYEHGRPDILMLDMQLPRVDGYEVARRIRQDHGDHETVIIAVTASAFVHQKSSILGSGCTDLLTKPFTRSQLFACLAQHTGMRFLYQRPSPAATHDDNPPSIDPELLARLSQAQLRELYQAALAGSSPIARELIAQIQPEHPLLAEQLSIAVDSFWITALADQIAPLFR